MVIPPPIVLGLDVVPGAGQRVIIKNHPRMVALTRAGLFLRLAGSSVRNVSCPGRTRTGVRKREQVKGSADKVRYL